MEKSFRTGVEDTSKRHVAIALPAKRVVILPPVSWDYITVDEGVEHIRGDVAFYAKRDQAKLVRGTFILQAEGSRSLPPMASIPQCRGDPEAFLLARTDAVLSWSFASESLENAGVPVVEVKRIVKVGPCNVRSLPSAWIDVR